MAAAALCAPCALLVRSDGFFVLRACSLGLLPLPLNWLLWMRWLPCLLLLLLLLLLLPLPLLVLSLAPKRTVPCAV